jgi:protein gp37
VLVVLMGTGAYWDKVLNAMIGCDPVSDGCDYCFAPPAAWIRKSNPNPAVAEAFRGVATKPVDGPAQWTGRVNELPDRLTQPLHWIKPVQIYITLLGDTFHDKVTTDHIAKIFAMVAVTRRHTYLNTTKRHARMRALLNDPEFFLRVVEYAKQLAGQPGTQEWDGEWPLPNLHLAVSVEDQKTARLRIPYLLGTPAAVRWISAEPLLDWIKLCNCEGFEGTSLASDDCPLHGKVRLDWVVTGGESTSPRATHPDWVRSLRDECVDSGTPFWFKQWGGHLPVPVVDAPGLAHGRAILYPDGGKASAVIREPGPSGTMRTAVTRALRPGDRTRGGVMLDENTFALKMSAKDAGRVLDGRTWDQLPAVCHA